MRVTFEDVVRGLSEEAPYVSVISNVKEYSPVFSGEEKSILLFFSLCYGKFSIVLLEKRILFSFFSQEKRTYNLFSPFFLWKT